MFGLVPQFHLNLNSSFSFIDSDYWFSYNANQHRRSQTYPAALFYKSKDWRCQRKFEFVSFTI